MARSRKRYVQQDIRFADKNGQNRGRRKGDGRGKRTGRPGRETKAQRAPHTPRPDLKSWQAVHIVLRVNSDVGSLRKRHMYSALREATLAVARREIHFEEQGAFRIVHISIQKTHVHLLVEADDKAALSSGMQGFQISAAKHINRAYSRWARLERRRRGNVFPDRYHQEIIKTPRQARNALSYVLNNWRKHREDRHRDARTWNVDPFSTGVVFNGWQGRQDAVVLWKWRDTYDPLVVYLPRTWLLQVGWLKYGRIGFREVPSANVLAKPKPKRHSVAA